MSNTFKVGQTVWVIREGDCSSAEVVKPDFSSLIERYDIKFHDGYEDNYPVSRLFLSKRELVVEAVNALTQSFIGVKENKEKKLEDFEDAVLQCSKAEKLLNDWKKTLREIKD